LAKLVSILKTKPDPERSQNHVDHLTPGRDDP
jgi:hypothetical protein